MSANKKSLLQRLQEGPVFCGEGYLFELEKRGYVQVGPFVPTVVIDHPEAVLELHREFQRCGSDIIEAFTYYGHREKLRLVGREGDLEKLNRQALQLAKKVAQEGNSLLAGNISNSTIWDPEDKAKQAEVHRQYAEQLVWAKEAGADFIIGETFDTLGEALAALEEIKKLGFVAVITMTFHQEETTRDGKSITESFQTLKKHGADVVGINCHRGPATILPLLRQVRKAVDGPIAAMPCPLRTTPQKPTMRALCQDPDHVYTDLEHHYCTRYEMAEFAKEAYALGVNYIGVCCGGQPYHLRSMAEALGKTTPASKFSPDLSKHFAFNKNTSQFSAKDRAFAAKF